MELGQQRGTVSKYTDHKVRKKLIKVLISQRLL